MDEPVPELTPEPPPRPVARPVARPVSRRPRNDDRRDDFEDREPTKSNMPLILVVVGCACILLLGAVGACVWYFISATQTASSKSTTTFSYVGTQTKPVGNTGFRGSASLLPTPSDKPPKNRISFANPPITELTFDDTVIRHTGELNDSDQTFPYPEGAAPIKCFNVTLEANQLYFIELTKANPAIAIQPRLAIRFMGLPIAEANTWRMDAARLAFVPHDSGVHFLIVGLREAASCPFNLTITKARTGDVWPPLVPRTIAHKQPELEVLRKIPPFKVGTLASAHNIRDTCYAYMTPLGPEKELHRLSFSITELEQFKLPADSGEIVALAADRQGNTFASMRSPDQPPKKGRDIRKDTIHVYTDQNFRDAGGRRNKIDLKPQWTIPVEGQVQDMVVSPDDKFLFFLNLETSKVNRINLQSQKLDGESEVVMENGATSMTLTPDGKALYVAGKDRKIVKLDPAKLTIVKSFALPTNFAQGVGSIVVTDTGRLLLREGTRNSARLWMGDVGTDAQFLLQPFPSTRLWQDFALSADQRHLYSIASTFPPVTVECHYLSPVLPGGTNSLVCQHKTLEIESRDKARLQCRDGYLLTDRGLLLQISPNRVLKLGEETKKTNY